eukprot:TRINITY_DN1125_c0_g1_i5.p1 TRINITY_DN1125_c0_g1~~TRINITY_DN1125_c0_g1_i5.p1  ORF type:complete len:351 (+),score=108.70 TRINITY_DN1125_c0_g1_i5:87-1139(+)
MAMMGSLMPQQHRPMGGVGGAGAGAGAGAAGAGAGAMPKQKQPPAGALMCVKHKKVRGPNNVEETYPNSREFQCKAGSECKVSENVGVPRSEGPTPPGNVTCVLHGKVRGPNNVEPTYPGSTSWKCKESSQCKIPAVVTQDPNAPSGPVACAVHGKMRGPNNVTETFPGSRQYRCREGSQCKLPANNEGMGGKPESSGQSQNCSLHGKLRGPNNVMLLPNGLYQCNPGTECKMSSSQEEPEVAGMYGQPAPIHPEGPTTCWAHQKKRSPNQLHQVNTPLGAQWECLPQFKCKGSTAAANMSQLPGAGSFPMATTLPAGIPDMHQYTTLPQHLLMQPPMGMMQLGPLSGHH